MHFGIFDLLQVTVFVSLFALVLAMPIALGIAIFLTQYSPRRMAGPLAYMVDLLAAVPSIIYGVWGLYVLAPRCGRSPPGSTNNLGWVFLFATGNASVSGGGTIFTAGIVLAVMILPIITAVTREVFVQTPQDQIEAALALGATRWEVVKTTVLPFGRSGYISGAMLGLGRALGETIALLIILRGTQAAFGWSLFDGGYTFATKIAATASEFNDQYKAGAYIAAGLVLFMLTFVVNCDGARRHGRKSRKRYPMTSILDRPLKARTFTGVSLRRRASNVVATVLVTLSVAMALVPLIWVLYSVVSKGIRRGQVDRVVDAFTSRHDGVRSRVAVRTTRSSARCCKAWCVRSSRYPSACSSRSISSSTAAAPRLAKLTTFMVDILTGVPSIVAALFIYALWIATLGFPRSGFAVSLALVLLMIPVIVRATEEMLRIVPMDLREASYALGVPKWKTIAKHRAFRPRCRASSPASCWRWPA